MCADPLRLGILGGTFDPVHLGHLASAREVAAAFDLDRVLLLLSARPPHRPDHTPAPIEQRMEMLALAAAGDALLQVCDLEVRRQGPSYTVDTLRELARIHPAAELFLILGADAYAEIDTWSRPRELPRLCNLIVTSRPGCACDVAAVPPPVAARGETRYDPSVGCHLHESGHVVVGHPIHGLEVSASEVRRRVALGLPIEHLTGPAVARFIHQHQLYGASAH
ncbi:MAG: nicotinate (nicotinamide) nucleotide adenylyltransferase [Deltaproteobacteria bacterium]|nr:nicotinate (nicotinamide) nucleotide adenylyltransferase [Deltaproteobacteria bacterium]